MAVLEVQAALARLQEGLASAGASTIVSASGGTSASATATVSGGNSGSASASANAMSVDKKWSHSCALCHRRLGVLYKVGLDIRHNHHQNRHHHSYVSLISISLSLFLSLLSPIYVVSCSVDVWT